MVENKKGNITVAFFVELSGFEPLSKHIRQKLSTCLFHDWLSALRRT
jgi:hypothetical protein